MQILSYTFLTSSKMSEEFETKLYDLSEKFLEKRYDLSVDVHLWNEIQYQLFFRNKH